MIINPSLTLFSSRHMAEFLIGKLFKEKSNMNYISNDKSIQSRNLIIFNGNAIQQTKESRTVVCFCHTKNEVDRTGRNF